MPRDRKKGGERDRRRRAGRSDSSDSDSGSGGASSPPPRARKTAPGGSSAAQPLDLAQLDARGSRAQHGQLAKFAQLLDEEIEKGLEGWPLAEISDLLTELGVVREAAADRAAYFVGELGKIDAMDESMRADSSRRRGAAGSATAAQRLDRTRSALADELRRARASGAAAMAIDGGGGGGSDGGDDGDFAERSGDGDDDERSDESSVSARRRAKNKSRKRSRNRDRERDRNRSRRAGGSAATPSGAAGGASAMASGSKPARAAGGPAPMQLSRGGGGGGGDSMVFAGRTSGGFGGMGFGTSGAGGARGGGGGNGGPQPYFSHATYHERGDGSFMLKFVTAASARESAGLIEQEARARALALTSATNSFAYGPGAGFTPTHSHAALAHAAAGMAADARQVSERELLSADYSDRLEYNFWTMIESYFEPIADEHLDLIAPHELSDSDPAFHLPPLGRTGGDAWGVDDETGEAARVRRRGRDEMDDERTMGLLTQQLASAMVDRDSLDRVDLSRRFSDLGAQPDALNKTTGEMARLAELEERVRLELIAIGLISEDQEFGDREDDEICVELRNLQKQLTVVIRESAPIRQAYTTRMRDVQADQNRRHQIRVADKQFETECVKYLGKSKERRSTITRQANLRQALSAWRSTRVALAGGATFAAQSSAPWIASTPRMAASLALPSPRMGMAGPGAFSSTPSGGAGGAGATGWAAEARKPVVKISTSNSNVIVSR